MRFTLATIIVLIYGQVSGQLLFGDSKVRDDSLNRVYFKRLKDAGQIDNKNLKTGLWTEYELLPAEPNQSVTIEIEGYRKFDSVEIAHSTKLIKNEGNYENGQMSGLWTSYLAEYFRDSLSWTMNKTAQYRMGKKNGFEKEFHFDYVFHESYYIDDLKEGDETFYLYPNKVFAKGEWKGGGLMHATEYYHTIGKIRTTKNYEEFPLVSVVEYYENGKIKATYTTLGDEEVLDGVYKIFNEKGRLIKTKKYDKGVELVK
jgi:antitoxin component YwqK of YwqJK toxin-antitoxin module